MGYPKDLVKLQKRFAYKYKDKEHYKYVITLPADAVDQLGWKPDIELAVTIVNKNVVLKPRYKRKLSSMGMSRVKKRPKHEAALQK